MGDGDTSIENTGYKIDGKSVPGTVGGNANDPQDGTSDKPMWPRTSVKCV